MTDTLRDRLGELVRDHKPVVSFDGRFLSCSCGLTLATIDTKSNTYRQITACIEMFNGHLDAALAAQPAPAVMGEDALERLDERWKARCRVLMGDIEKLKAQARTAAAESREGGIKVIWHGTTDSHGTNDSKECSTGRIYTDPLMQQAYDEGFAHGAQQPGESPT